MSSGRRAVGRAVQVRWLTAGEQAAWRAWLDMYRLLLPALDRQLQSESRANFTDFEVLVHLSEAPDRRLRMSELADRTLSTRSAITRTVDRLVAREWVRRVRSTADQRGFYAELTGLGQEVLAEIAPGHVAAVREYLIDLLTEPELAALRSIGRRVRQRMAGTVGGHQAAAHEASAEATGAGETAAGETGARAGPARETGTRAARAGETGTRAAPAGETGTRAAPAGETGARAGPARETGRKVRARGAGAVE